MNAMPSIANVLAQSAPIQNDTAENSFWSILPNLLWFALTVIVDSTSANSHAGCRCIALATSHGFGYKSSLPLDWRGYCYRREV